MPTVRRITPLVVLLLAAAGAEAQQLEPRPVPSQGIESFTFVSPSMGVRFGVNVGIPQAPRAPGARLPALIVTDGDQAFPAAFGAAHGLMSQGSIEDLFVVSIGSILADGDSSWTRRRVYEFSPPDWDMKDAFGVLVKQTCAQFGSAPDRCVGGAPAFLRVIVRELIPAIVKRYPIDPERLGLFGVSAGGFFAAWTMFQAEAPFRNYLISSPAMAYGDGAALREEARFAESHKDMAVGIYLGSGSLEADDPMLEGIGQIVSGQARLAARLRSRNYPSLRLTTEVLPGFGHSDVAPAVLARGLRVLYPKRP